MPSTRPAACCWSPPPGPVWRSSWARRLPPVCAGSQSGLEAAPGHGLRCPAKLPIAWTGWKCFEPRAEGLPATLATVAAMSGPIPIVQLADGNGGYRLDWLVDEVSTSINTAAAGGNASLMALV